MLPSTPINAPPKPGSMAVASCTASDIIADASKNAKPVNAISLLPTRVWWDGGAFLVEVNDASLCGARHTTLKVAEQAAINRFVNGSLSAEGLAKFNKNLYRLCIELADAYNKQAGLLASYWAHCKHSGVQSFDDYLLSVDGGKFFKATAPPDPGSQAEVVTRCTDPRGVARLRRAAQGERSQISSTPHPASAAPDASKEAAGSKRALPLEAATEDVNQNAHPEKRLRSE